MALMVARLGQLPIRVHWSLLPALIGLGGCASLLFQGRYAIAEAWLAGLATVVLIYLAVLAHELAHAVASRAAGMPVLSITIFGFGGRTEVDEALLEPQRELLVACAGPVASLALTIAWALTTPLVAGSPLEPLIVAQLFVNGGLLLLNLLPSYPLDGGRILKAALWLLIDDELPAARTAALIARLCGWTLLGIGLACALVTGAPGAGVAIALAGIYLSRTAAAGMRDLALRRALSGVRAADIMQRSLGRVAPSLPLDQFVGRYVIGQAEQCFPVVADPDSPEPQPLLGMLTLRDMRRYPYRVWAHTHVADAMRPAERVAALSPETSADEALRLLLDRDEDLLPVVEGGMLLGVVRRRDLLFLVRMRAGRDL